MQTRSTKSRSIKRTRRNKTHKSNPPKQSRLLLQFVPTFLHMLNTVKLYHWKTTSFSTHKATDELYSELNEKIDEFVEILLGKPNITINIKNRIAILNVNTIKLHDYSNNEEFKRQIEHYKTFLIDFSKNSSFNIAANSDLINKRDEILGILNQFLYLLTLKN